MWKKIGRGLLVAWGAAMLLQQPRAADVAVPAALPPAQAFFGNDEIGGGVLSPSGRWLAVAIHPADARRGIAVYDLHGQEPPRSIASFSDIDIGTYAWVGEERLVFELYDQNRGGADQRYGPGLFTVRRDGSDLRQLILMQWWSRPAPGTASTRRLDATHRLLLVPREQTPGAETVIVYGERDATNPDSDWALKRLNLVTGRAQLMGVDEPPGLVQSWFFDRNGEPRYAAARLAGQVSMLQREVDAAGVPQRGWRVLMQAPSTELPWQFHSIDGQGGMYVTEFAGVAQELVLKRFDLARRAPEAQPLVAVPGFDFRGRLLVDDEDGRPLGVRAMADAESTTWFDASMAAVQKAIDARLPERVNSLSCRRCRHPDRTVLVESYADRHPGELWLWRGEADKPGTWRRIGIKRPAIDARRMASLDLTRYTARDGRSIPLWVTLPAAAEAGSTPTPAPAVLLVHGGPWVRGGTWEWDPLPQFLASRGYVVLEPEFRGSTGFGSRHFRAGWKQWGLAMQDDLADAVAWAAERGLVDPKRVCIAGGSYGGYAALMGLVRQADVFRCGAAWAAVTEPTWLLREGSPDLRSDEVSAYALPLMLGDTLADRDRLRETSPLQQAARIRAPLLLAWGDRDRRVPPEHSERLAAALRAAGQVPEVVSYEGEGHSWLKTQNWLDFARRLEALLARELKPPARP